MQPVHAEGLVLYRFELLHPLGLRHAVSTRPGGASAGPFAGLNLSASVGDDPAAVAENRRRFARAAGLEGLAVVGAEQVHGSVVARVESAPEDSWTDVAGADALVTERTDVALAVRGADCPLVVIFAPPRGPLAVVHAGWRGTLDRIAEAAVREMCETSSASPGDMIAGIGPAIEPRCYEVGPEVAERAAADEAFAPLVQERSGRTFFDLVEANAAALAAAGLADRAIERAGLCTRCRTDLFYSFRAAGAPTGRHALVATLAGPK